MLNKIKNQENFIMLFFVVLFIVIGCFLLFDVNVVDVVYLMIVGYYFIRFLIVKLRG